MVTAVSAVGGGAGFDRAATLTAASAPLATPQAPPTPPAATEQVGAASRTAASGDVGGGGSEFLRDRGANLSRFATQVDAAPEPTPSGPPPESGPAETPASSRSTAEAAFDAARSEPQTTELQQAVQRQLELALSAVRSSPFA